MRTVRRAEPGPGAVGWEPTPVLAEGTCGLGRAEPGFSPVLLGHLTYRHRSPVVGQRQSNSFRGDAECSILVAECARFTVLLIRRE